MNRDLYDKATRAAKLAKTHLRRAEDLMYACRNDGTPVPSWYGDALEQALGTAEAIIEHGMPDEHFVPRDVADFFGLGGARNFNPSDQTLERVRKIEGALASRRAKGKKQGLIAKLANTEGRTPEEAEAFRRKAEELAG